MSKVEDINLEEYELSPCSKCYNPESCCGCEKYYKWKEKHDSESKSKIKKILPRIDVSYTNGIDGRDAHYYVSYRCPTCNKPISYFKAETACDQCGTFYKWPDEPAHIEITRQAKW